MNSRTARQEAIARITDYIPEDSGYDFIDTPVPELFGSKVFSNKVM